MHEQNPMLGLRGVRLGIVIPGLFAMQARAIAEAAAIVTGEGKTVRPEIMVPLVAGEAELPGAAEIEGAPRWRPEPADGPDPDRRDDRGAEGGAGRRADRPVRRLLLVRHQRPHPADLGVQPRRRGGVDLPALLRPGIFAVSPFESVDVVGVGRLVRIAVAEGRSATPTW